MENFDARKLKSDAQELLRQQAVRAVIEGGMTKTKAAEFFGVSRYSIIKWTKSYNEQGDSSLKARKRGRPNAAGELLAPWQQAQIAWAITNKCPDQHQLPFMLWTRHAVAQLVKRRYNIRLALSTVSRYLKKWGFSPQKPVYKAIQRDPKKVVKWLQTEYPQIKARAKQEKAEILWSDEMGVRSDHTCGRSFSPKGQTPVVKKSARRWSCNMISAISNSGTMRFMLYEETLTVSVFIKFLDRLIKGSNRKVFVILDNLKVHHAKKVQEWVNQRKDKIELFFLPPYSPDLNPDELLNQDVKSNACHTKLIHTTKELKKELMSYLKSIQQTPKKIKNFFLKNSVAYAS